MEIDNSKFSDLNGDECFDAEKGVGAEYTFGDHNKPKKRRFVGVLKYVLVATMIFAITFLVSNWPAYKVIFGYYLGQYESSESVNLFAVSDDPGELNVPLKVATPLQISAGVRIKIGLTIPLSPPDNRIIIPKFSLSVPVNEIDLDGGISDQKVLDNQIQNALKSGVVLYPGTAKPGTRGNSFITGHSSYYLWDPGKYKDVFVLLPKLEVNDDVIVFYNQKEIKYRVVSKKEVWPNQVDVLRQTDDYRLTLMTCVPIGTNLRRLIVVAEIVE